MDHAAPSRTPAPGPLDEISVVVPLSVGQEFDCFQDFKVAVGSQQQLSSLIQFARRPFCLQRFTREYGHISNLV